MHQTQKPKGSRTAKITAIVGDDYHDLKLDFGLIQELEDKHDKGAMFILRRLTDFDHTGSLAGDFRVIWIVDVIRLGLIGGGMSPREALRYTDLHLRDAFVLDYIAVAANALAAGLHGPSDDPVKFDEPKAGEEPGEPTPEVTPTPSAASHGENIGSSAAPSDSTPNP